MSTFEGPLLSLKSVNAISHFTDWTIAHVHIGTLGWNGMMAFGMLYWLFPRFYKVKLILNITGKYTFLVGHIRNVILCDPTLFCWIYTSINVETIYC